MIGLDAFSKTYTLTKALLTGRDVSPEQMQARLEICRACDKVTLKGMLMRCSICGCQVKESGLINLARYRETADYGCKHDSGSKWKAAGC